MIPTNSRPLEGALIRFLNSLVYDTTTPFVFTAFMRPVNVRLHLANSFYAKILFDVAFSLEPTLEQFSGMDFVESDEEVYQHALYLYKKWSDEGLEEAVLSYCRHLNRILDRSPLAQGAAPGAPLPDFCRYERDIISHIERLKKKEA